jgi:hypothetical protein
VDGVPITELYDMQDAEWGKPLEKHFIERRELNEGTGGDGAMEETNRRNLLVQMVEQG